jgi:hypothetical protein
MIRKRNYRTWLACMPVILAVAMLAGCAVKTANLWGDRVVWLWTWKSWARPWKSGWMKRWLSQ